MKKIAFIVQRYGLEINGGAELHCMQLAQKLSLIYEVEILTTCALDYITWADHYPEGETKVNGLTVRRFKVAQLRNEKQMLELEKKVRAEKPVLSKTKKIKKFFRELFFGKDDSTVTDKDYLDWIIAQGPATPDLINYIKTHEQEYDCLVFFTYLYYPTVFGIEINPPKTIFIPTAHDEWAIRMPVYKKMFTTPACIMYNTIAEKRFINRLYNNESVYSEIAGVGVDVPSLIPAGDLKISMNIGSAYVLYVGRIDVNKITPTDFEWFFRYIKETKKDIKLVLVGNKYMNIPDSDRIVWLGFVDEEIKFGLMRQSLFLFQPSRFESLSMVVLESFMMERPVLVHRDCEVMKDHIDSSHGGLYYNDYESFKQAFDQLINDQFLNTEMGKAGKIYVDKNYRWEKIIGKFQNVIENRISNKN